MAKLRLNTSTKQSVPLTNLIAIDQHNMPEFWRQNSKHRKLSRTDNLLKTDFVDSHRTLTPKSSYSSSYSGKDFSVLAQERSHQKKLERVETQETLQLFNPLRQSPPSPPPPISSDVLVVGAGPAGLMLAYGEFHRSPCDQQELTGRTGAILSALA
jgi:NADPH-dependent glutamate synthase beta subunit-like oxidoreductase